MQVLLVASEVFPYSRTGGLADVMAALPEALVRLGLDVTVLSPWWQSLNGTPREVWRPSVARGGRLMPGDLRVGQIDEAGVKYLFLGTPEFDRPGLYAEDDVERFSRWGRQVLPTLSSMGLTFDLIHGHDWGAGLVLAHARQLGLKSVYTIHNLQYQGRWNLRDGMAWSGLPESAREGVEFFGDINLMKAGLVYSDHVTTVSPTYAHEITTPEYGERLEGVLQERQAQGALSGILNGLDLERWNPATDPDIHRMTSLSGKAANIAALRHEFSLDSAPILSAVTRLVSQKGIDLLVEALHEVTQDWNVVVLGSGDPLLEAALTGWAQHPRVRYVSGMNEALAHRLYAGSDAFAMPSRFEPCGLSQMIAMRYGTLPVVRETGGLVDSVPPEVGFRFAGATAADLTQALRTARASFENIHDWKARTQRGMVIDFSWEASARQYLDVYERVLG
ncbi:glycogen synthase [Deinococcus sp. KNUC1210]|uniref:glycogen synthase n=1 Tax=Deinococcus sp. KNUC1210 TaxID=2917691 RepID=UPI001EF15819|nr:glycogen/starch synthase [Deinococcus sp. KNUC1210]ULH16219.1 glycogen synthase [Deinococcus sp. KNUC1210]